MPLQVLTYKPSDNDYRYPEPDEEAVGKVLTLKTFADFRHLRLLDINFLDLPSETDAPSWSVELHPNFAGSFEMLHINDNYAWDA